MNRMFCSRWLPHSICIIRSSVVLQFTMRNPLLVLNAHLQSFNLVSRKPAIVWRLSLDRFRDYRLKLFNIYVPNAAGQCNFIHPQLDDRLRFGFCKTHGRYVAQVFTNEKLLIVPPHCANMAFALSPLRVDRYDHLHNIIRPGH